LVILALLGLSLAHTEPASSAAEPKPAGKPDDAALARTRKMVQTLDNVYKQTIVLITDKYVHDENDFPAGSAAVLLFRKISAGGSHTVRLIDATGKPIEATNVAADDFEKEGVKRLKSGAAYFDQVIEQEGKPRLRAITPVPVALKKCIMCHAHYADAKPGEPIGAITYSIPIE
jgi:hypothetical protein